MKTNVIINKDDHPKEDYPWFYLVQGPLGDSAPSIDHGHMRTREEAEELSARIVDDANTLGLSELMDKYGAHWMAPDD